MYIMYTYVYKAKNKHQNLFIWLHSLHLLLNTLNVCNAILMFNDLKTITHWEILVFSLICSGIVWYLCLCVLDVSLSMGIFVKFSK